MEYNRARNIILLIAPDARNIGVLGNTFYFETMVAPDTLEPQFRAHTFRLVDSFLDEGTYGVYVEASDTITAREFYKNPTLTAYWDEGRTERVVVMMLYARTGQLEGLRGGKMIPVSNDHILYR